ncbi:hypothetical protein IX307_001144 [Bacteroides pyogenes]|uniref:hypothetical protein n=1 Tax=Bacteroides pyogenes TaxID=310300 RepID=UPI001BAC71DA|nr:hypothetical protein [Bacteroides pyogenes]MBR8719969.1 hypothetical protein [Bacteroides pyogenes]MBR8786830.1 hypothetical protein [Bacteroides pyogenes]MBR8792315.1 hypothetical protein [Bacteroides pyogenes]
MKNKDSDSINYIDAYGLSKVKGDLLYREVPGGFAVAYITANNIDVWLCRMLPKNHEEIRAENVIHRIISFNTKDENKVRIFREKIMGYKTVRSPFFRKKIERIED